MKGSQKPKKLGKKPAQKTLKERRTAKRAAAKGSAYGYSVSRRIGTEPQSSSSATSKTTVDGAIRESCLLC